MAHVQVGAPHKWSAPVEREQRPTQRCAGVLAVQTNDCQTLLAMNHLKAFVVEDSSLVLRELSSMLAETSAINVVASADSESDALRTLRTASTAYDLIIVDMFLKQGSGLRVLRDARVLQPKSRLVVLTNYATLDVRKRCISLGADRVFDKSKQLQALIDYCCVLSGVDDLQHIGADEGPPTVPSGAA
jgi:CheY-like chemotaxis protein